MTGGSLSLRLLALAVIWILLALAVAGVVLTDLFRRHAEAELARRMEYHLDELTAALDVAPDGTLTVARPLSDPRFHRPLSGLYWQAAIGPDAILRSRSLWDQVLDLPHDLPRDGEVHRHALTGPAGEPLVAWERSLRLPGLETPVRAAVVADAAAVHAATADFRRALVLSLAVLAVGLLAAAVAQVRLGLVPLKRLLAALGALRSGRAGRLEGGFPVEVQPVVHELNQLLAENAEMVARARAQAGDLAHALKTPLAVIANAAAAQPDPDSARIIAEEAQRMRRQIDRYLARARAASALRGAAAATPVLPALDGLARAVQRLQADRTVRIALAGDRTARFRGDVQDLQEMAGNLIDNAAKWCAGTVRVTVAAAADRVRIAVDDDGPGIPEARRAALPARGTRLDETVPGTGLGLAITDELARLYGGGLTLGESPLGGLKAELDLPGRVA